MTALRLACLLAASLAASAVAQVPCDGAFHGQEACSGNFNPMAWSVAFVGTSSGGIYASSAIAMHDSSCGAPSPGLSVTTNVNATLGYAYAGVSLLCAAAAWNPDSATTRVCMSIDNIAQSSGGAGQAVFPLLKQGTKTYIGSATTTGLPATWATLVLPPHAASDFRELTGPNFTTDPNSHPDFANGAATITFGFLVGNSGGSSYSRSHCYDNWQVVRGDLASFSSYGTGCGVECPDSFVEEWTPGSIDLGFTSVYTMIPNGSGYVVLPGGTAFVAPSPAATVLALGDDTEAFVTPSVPFPTPCDGQAPQFAVCSNGFVSLGSNGTGFAPDVGQMLSAPKTAWWSWHDFDPSMPGSGKVKYEEVGSVVYITWDGVHDWGGTSSSTFQFQFDLTNGNVSYVCQDMSPLGNAHVVGYSRGGTPLGACVTDLSALVSPLTLCCSQMGTTPLQLTMLDRPVIGTTPRFYTSNIPTSTLFTFVAFGSTPLAFDLTPLMPGCFLLQDLALPFGPFEFWPGATSVTTYGLLSPVPNLLGARVYAQAVAWVGGLQTGITSNGIEMVLGY